MLERSTLHALKRNNQSGMGWVLVEDTEPQAIEGILRDRLRLRISFFSWDGATSDLVELILKLAAKVFEFPFSVDPLVFSIQELALNGIKANMKKAAIQDSDSKDHGLRLFKSQLGRGASDLARLAKKHDFWTAIIIRPETNRLRLEVINASPLLGEEQTRIQEKLVMAKNYDSVECFYKEAGDVSEGAGLGLYLVSQGLRSLAVKRCWLRIRSNKKGHTIARISLLW